MLISFEIENYRSIKERQTLLMTASNYYLENEESLIDENLLGLVNTRLVPVCAIFGANASGKTTIIRAMDICLMYSPQKRLLNLRVTLLLLSLEGHGMSILLATMLLKC